MVASSVANREVFFPARWRFFGRPGCCVMRSSTTLDYVTLGGTVIANKLRRHPLEAMTLRWESQVEWIDVQHQNRLRDSRWYCHWNQIKTSSSQCEDASLEYQGAFTWWLVSTTITWISPLLVSESIWDVVDTMRSRLIAKHICPVMMARWQAGVGDSWRRCAVRCVDGR